MASFRARTRSLRFIIPMLMAIAVRATGAAAADLAGLMADSGSGAATAAESRPVSIRIAWGGGPARSWRGSIVAVEPAAAPAFSAALAAGHPVDVPIHSTLADGLAVGRVGDIPFALAAPLVDRVVTIGEEEISLAVVRLLELEMTVAEGAAAAALAAVLGAVGADLAGRPTVLLLCGGNIDLTILDRVIDRGLAADGRRWRFSTQVSDRPGGIARLTAAIAAAGASVQEIVHDRGFSGPDVFSTAVAVTVDTADRGHVTRLIERLVAEGFQPTPAAGRAE